MKVNGDIVIVEDNTDERELLSIVFDRIIKEQGYLNKVVILDDATSALEYLKKATKQPFIFISDISMPNIDGFSLRETIFNDERLRELCVPYIFLTSGSENPENVKKAYQLSVQGYFKKADNLKEYETLVRDLLNYWKRCLTPHMSF